MHDGSCNGRTVGHVAFLFGTSLVTSLVVE